MEKCTKVVCVLILFLGDTGMFVFLIIKVYKHNHTDLVYFTFIQCCYMFRLFTAAIIR